MRFLLHIVTALGLFAATITVAQQVPYALTIHTAGKARLHPSDTPVYVEFEKSPSLTDALRKDLAASGFAVSNTPESAHVAIRMRGFYIADGHGVTATEPIASIAEAKPNKATREPSVKLPGGQPKPASGETSAVLGAGPSIDLTDKAETFRERFRAATPSCPPAGCEEPRIIAQRVVLNIDLMRKVGAEKASVTAMVSGELLMPDMLIHGALYRALAILKGGA